MRQGEEEVAEEELKDKEDEEEIKILVTHYIYYFNKTNIYIYGRQRLGSGRKTNDERYVVVAKVLENTKRNN